MQNKETPQIEETAQTEQPKRKRGGQIGNSNRLDHGFYSKSFKPTEKEALLTLKEGLASEVEMLRVAIHRVFRMMKLPRGSKLDPWQKNTMMCQTLSTLGIATTRLAHMLRCEKFLAGGSSSEIEELMNTALDVLEEDDSAL